MLTLLGSLAGACSRRDARRDMTEYVLIYPGSPVVELSGDSTTFEVKVRNVSPLQLTELRLECKSEAASATVSPVSIAELSPGDRKTFQVQLTRAKSKPRRRYELQLTLQGGGLPVAAGVDLLVDLEGPPGKGWIDVGQVTLIHRKHSRASYYVLAGAPLLLVCGWLLWRYSRPRGKRAS